MIRISFAICLALSLIPAMADQPKSFEDAFGDSRLRQDYRSADAYIKKILELHEKEFPGAMRHDYLHFHTNIDRLSWVQQGLLTSLMKQSQYRKDWRDREPMTDLTVTALISIGKAEEEEKFNKKAWNEFKDLMIRPLEKFDTIESGLEAMRSKLIKSSTRWDLAAYVIYSSLLRGRKDMTVAELKKLVQNLEVGALDYLHDRESYSQFFEFANDELVFPSYFRLKVRFGIEDAYYDVNRALYRDRDQDPISFKKGDVVRIREVHPNLAIFRGYVGNDCATIFSPGFVFTPYDRYYYVYDGNNAPLGYVGLSIVKIDDKKAIFLHTIQGPAFTAGQAQLVMRGIQKAAASLGQKVVLGRDHNISMNVNFSPIRTAMFSAVQGVKSVDVEWLDRMYRKTIVEWDSQLTYDDPDNNKQGRELAFNSSEVAVTIKQRPFVAKFLKPILKSFKRRPPRWDCSATLSGEREREW